MHVAGAGHRRQLRAVSKTATAAFVEGDVTMAQAEWCEPPKWLVRSELLGFPRAMLWAQSC